MHLAVTQFETLRIVYGVLTLVAKCYEWSYIFVIRNMQAITQFETLRIVYGVLILVAKCYEWSYILLSETCKQSEKLAS